jgi:hypothetical protein
LFIRMHCGRVLIGRRSLSIRNLRNNYKRFEWSVRQLSALGNAETDLHCGGVC